MSDNEQLERAAATPVGALAAVEGALNVQLGKVY